MKLHQNETTSGDSSSSSPPRSPSRMALMIDQDVLCKNQRSLRSQGTAATINSNESYASSAKDSQVSKSQDSSRPPFRRSMTDQEFNLFLDFLEAPRSSNDCIPDQINTDEDHEYEIFLDFLQSSSSKPSSDSCISSHAGTQEDHTPPCIQRVSTNDKDLSLDFLLPGIQHTSRSKSHASLLDVHLFEELEEACSTPEPTPANKMPRSQSTQSISSTMALGAFAALLGTRSPLVPFHEKKRFSKNLWSDDSANDDDIISLPDSEGFFIDDVSYDIIPSLEMCKQ